MIWIVFGMVAIAVLLFVHGADVSGEDNDSQDYD